MDQSAENSIREGARGDSDLPLESAMPTAMPTPAPMPTGARRIGWLVLGLALVGIGIIGLFVPLLPTTDFMLLALPCFARSSPRLERWLVEHPVFGPPIRAWRQHRAIPRHAKIAACVGMALGFALFCWLAHPRTWLVLLIGGLLVSCAVWIVRRPSTGAV